MSNDEYLKKKNSKKPEFLNMSSAKDFQPQRQPNSLVSKLIEDSDDEDVSNKKIL